jgi:hypothetical protein
VENAGKEAVQVRSGFWHAVVAAFGALARRTGCSLNESPLPEIREAARDLDWHKPPRTPA